MMVSSQRKCPGVEGKVCDSSCPPRRTIPITYVLPVVAIPAGMTIAVRNSVIGVTIAETVCLIACSY